MCDPTGAQKSALADDQAFGAALRSSYGTDFSDAKGLFDELHSNLEGIVAAGPSQTGESPAELAAKNSQAINSAAGANKNIQAAIGQRPSSGSAAPGIESGVTEAVRARAMTDVENNLSNQQADITKENYDIGRKNYDTATSKELMLPAATMDPVSAAAKGVTAQADVTQNQANTNAAASKSWIGLVGGLADSAVGGLTGAGGLLSKGKK